MFAGAQSPRDARQKMVCVRQYQIAVIVGSLRRESINRKLATALAGLAPAEFAFVQLEIGDLPLYNQDDDNPSESVKRLKSAIAPAQGVLFVTPEPSTACCSTHAVSKGMCVSRSAIRKAPSSTFGATNAMGWKKRSRSAAGS